MLMAISAMLMSDFHSYLSEEWLGILRPKLCQCRLDPSKALQIFPGEAAILKRLAESSSHS